MKVLLLGANGQLGRELTRVLAGVDELLIATRDGAPVNGHSALSVDLDLPVRLREVVRDTAPSVLVNAAAYTAVDRAEEDPETAHRINAVAPGVLGEEMADQGGLLVHYSTDYVFSGESSRPWRETDPTVPINIYGHSKLGGEEAIRLSGCSHLILRSSWIYEAHGHNFLRTMLRVGAGRDRLDIVDDQTGAPTRARDIAEATRQILAGLAERGGAPAERLNDRGGTYHLANAGQTTWFGYAEALFAEAVALGLLERAPELHPTSSEAFGAPARRPSYSVLDCSRIQEAFGVELPPWQTSVASCLRELTENTEETTS